MYLPQHACHPHHPPQVLLPAQAPDGSGNLLGCVVEARILSASRWSVKGEVLRLLYRPPDSQEGAAAAASTVDSGAPAARTAGSRGDGSSSGGPQLHAQAQLQQAEASIGGSHQQGCDESCACENSSSATQQQGQQPASMADDTQHGCGKSCSCEPGSSMERQQLPAGADAAAAAAAQDPGGSGSRPQDVASPPRSSLSDEQLPSTTGGLVGEASGISVRSDGSVFPLARAEASQDLAGAAGGASGDAGGQQLPKQPASSTGGLGEAVLLAALLIGLLGMLLSGVLSLLSQP